MREHNPNTTNLYGTLGYVFENIKLLEQSLTHRSTGAYNNERLEFLGDAVLGLVIADILFHHLPIVQEGKMSQRRAALVNSDSLAALAEQLELDEYLRLSPSERKSGGATRVSILAGALESVVGAIYLDGGFDEIRRCVLFWLGPELETVRASEIAGKGPKSRLQEYMQANQLPRPNYTLAEIMGKPHEQTFCINCQVEGIDLVTQGLGRSRRKAEQAAAEHYLSALSEVSLPQ